MLTVHRLKVLSLICCLGIVLSGCTPLLIAASAGAVGGYSISRDSVEGVTSNSQEELWDAGQKVLAIMGSLSESDRNKGEMIGQVNGARVTVSLLPINLTTTKLRVKARKTIFPRVGVAQDVYTKIMNQLGQ